MHKKLKFLLTVSFVLIFAGGLRAQESFIPDISYPYLQKLIDTAKKYYPEVKIKATQTAIARTSYNQSKTSWFDIITPSYLYNPDKSSNLITPTAFNSYQLAVTVNLGSIIAKPFLIHNAKQAVEVAKLQQDEYDLTIEAQVKRLYFTYLETQADLRLRTKAILDAQANVSQLKYKFEKGEGTLSDYNSALTALYTQSAYRIQGELAVYNAKVSLEEFVGKKLEDIK
jgi:outer membrane protein TolC